MQKVDVYRCDANKLLLKDTVDFTVDDITGLLRDMGLVDVMQTCRVEQLEKYVFLYGDEQEVYVREERQFIEDTGKVYIFNEFDKRTRCGTMPCRVIAAELNTHDAIRSSIFLMKEINKAIGGFSLFFIKVYDEFYLGMRMFNKDVKNDCLLSSPIRTEEDFENIKDILYFVPDEEEFIQYYGALVDAIEYYNQTYKDNDSRIIRKRGIQYSYLELLVEIENKYKLNVNCEKNRYYSSFEETVEENYSEISRDVIDELHFIESFKANTMEMLFEAEEMVQLANKTEEENERILLEHEEDTTSNSKDYKKMKDYLEDPEKIIKLLKQQKGL